MQKILVVYYSRSGKTQALAEVIASACGADLEALQDVKKRTGFFGYWRSGREALKKQLAEIRDTVHDPADYDLVVLGTPVWAGSMSSPMRTYITRNHDAFRQIAVFCTMGGSGGDGTLAGMAALAGLDPLARLSVKEHEIKSGAAQDKAAAFVHDLVNRAGPD